ncbi:MAG: 50S ribosomal protein L18 [Spirochaetes bacterium]|nr:50S ribosomal protein L18 [Spirochaetota bacterium]
MDKLSLKKTRFSRRRVRIKNKIRKNSNLLRLCISRSNKNFYAQIIDDSKGHTLVAMSTLSNDFPETKNCGNLETAKSLGKLIAEKAVASGIKRVVFDRNGYLYHGKIKAFADSARENGLEF